MRRRRDGREAAAGGDTGDGVRRAGGETGLPVFLSPSELVFYLQQSSQRRVLTLYNPYSFSLRFKMLCTSPSLYRVMEPEGSVRAKSCVDLVVRHLAVAPGNQGRRDRFRVEVKGGGRAGGREVWAELRGGEEGGGGGGGGGEEEEERKTRRRGGGQQRRPHTHLPTCTAVPSVAQWVVCVVAAAALCVCVLMLPLHTESSRGVPACLHVTANQKLACAYTLGLLTVAFLR